MPKRAPLNVLLLVVDSLRAQSLAANHLAGPLLGKGTVDKCEDPLRQAQGERKKSLEIEPQTARAELVEALFGSKATVSKQGEVAATPFLDRLGQETIRFRRAFATECWTLPSHASMFTGLLPSEHGAHFHTMAYRGAAPTIAEILSEAGYATELITRNFVFDGTIPGITRGFRKCARPLSRVGAWNPFALLLALAKPRFRRHVRTTGFFHAAHRENREFLETFARSLHPADDVALDLVLDTMAEHRRRGRRYFIFCNLYDVHAPYPPRADSILRPFSSPSGFVENLFFGYDMSRLGAHRYLRKGFRMSDRGRRTLLGRYHDAIGRMDGKLAEFWHVARAAGFLDDTLVILTSDHGEAFGDHGLYLHDASVYNTHLHVPLWVHHPDREPETVDDIVSTRDLFGLMRAAGTDRAWQETILDSAYRAQHPIALAEHFHYPHLPDAMPRFRQDLIAAIADKRKVIVRAGGAQHYDLERDPDEREPLEGPVEQIDALWERRLSRAALDEVVGHLRRQRSGAPPVAA